MNGWDWRKASSLSVLLIDVDRELGRFIFHAYDGRDHAACDPIVGLGRSVEEPNEGSEFCPKCVDIVRAGPPESVGRVSVTNPLGSDEPGGPR